MKTLSLALAALLFAVPALGQERDAPPPPDPDRLQGEGEPESEGERQQVQEAGTAPPVEPAQDATGAAAPGGPDPASADAAKAVQDANNPLAPVLGFNLQNYYSPSLNELPDTSSSAMLLRVVSPFWRLLPRATLPVATQSSPAGSISGLGDLQIFVAYLVTPPGAKLQFGLGPQYTAPTATDPALGSGKHSLGGAAILVWVHDKLMLGSLVQAQGSIAGDAARPDVTTMWTQIFAILQLGGGYYLRSTPVATFQFATGDYQVPIGLGAGKVAMIDRTVLNWFVEPQATFLVEGAGQPLFQLFMGLNIQYKL